MATPGTDIADRFAALDRKCQRLQRLLVFAIAIAVLAPIAVVRYGGALGLVASATELQVNRIVFADGRGVPYVTLRESGEREGVEIVYAAGAENDSANGRVPPESQRDSSCTVTILQPGGVRVDQVGVKGKVVYASALFGSRSRHSLAREDFGVFLYNYRRDRPTARFPISSRTEGYPIQSSDGYRFKSLTIDP